MTPEQFIRKWAAASLSEKSAAQQHFVVLCSLLGEVPPAEADPTGETFPFERTSVNNLEFAWHPLRLAQRSTTNHDEVPQNSRKNMVLFMLVDHLVGHTTNVLHETECQALRLPVFRS